MSSGRDSDPGPTAPGAAPGARSVRFLAPPGYGRVVPLDRQRHAGLGLRRDASQLWARRLNAIPIGVAEFFQVALHYPIAFLKEARSGEFRPLAVMGLREGENLFVDAGGHWAAQLYVPAYVRRHPFCVAPVNHQGATGTLICVQEDQLSPDTAAPLFSPAGAPTEAWTTLQRLIEAVEGAHQQTRVLCRRLEALELLVPFDALAVPRSGTPLRLRGLHRVDEARLPRVPGRDLRRLLTKGELRAVYAHLLSLENFGRLLDRSLP